MNTFFIITVPSGQDAKEWAKRYWDTYGFDYDLERTGGDTIFAWPYNDWSDKDDARAASHLQEQLDDEGIEYETTKMSLDDAFGPVHDWRFSPLWKPSQ